MLALHHGPGCVLSACVVDVLRLKQQDPDFFFGDGPVLYTFGDNDDFSWPHVNLSVSKFHDHVAVNHMEEFVLVVMTVPNEIALDFGQFDILPVQLRDDFWGPMAVKQSKLFL